MMQSDWNQLCVDDQLVLHDRQRSPEPIFCTVVSMDAKRPEHAVSVRVDGADDETPQWPSRLAVHAATQSAMAVCPWCVRAKAGPPRPTRPHSWITR